MQSSQGEEREESASVSAPVAMLSTAAPSFDCSSNTHPPTANIITDAGELVNSHAEEEATVGETNKEEGTPVRTSSNDEQRLSKTKQASNDDQDNSIMAQKQRPRELRSTQTRISKKERMPRGNSNKLTVSAPRSDEALPARKNESPSDLSSILAEKQRSISRGSNRTRITKLLRDTSISSSVDSGTSVPEEQGKEAAAATAFDGVGSTVVSEDDSILTEKKRLQARSSACTRISKNPSTDFRRVDASSSSVSSSGASFEEVGQPEIARASSDNTVLTEKQRLLSRSSGERSRTTKMKRAPPRSSTDSSSGASRSGVIHEGEARPNEATRTENAPRKDDSILAEKQRISATGSRRIRILKQQCNTSSFSSVNSEASIPENQEVTAASSSRIGNEEASEDNSILTEKQSLGTRSSAYMHTSKTQTYPFGSPGTSRSIMASPKSDASFEEASQSRTRATDVLTEKQRLCMRGSAHTRTSKQQQYAFGNPALSSSGDDTSSLREEAFADETNESSEEYSILTEKHRILERSSDISRASRQHQPALASPGASIVSVMSDITSSQQENEAIVNEEFALGPGAFSVSQYYDGAEEVAESDAQTNFVSQEVDTGVPDADVSTNPHSNETNGNGILIEANLVDEADASLGPLVSAKRDNWYRRNQSWLAGSAVLLIVVIILTVVLTTVDLGPASAPTMSPTTQIESVEAEIEAIVLAAFPSAAEALSDESSSQAKALQWLSAQRFNDPAPLSIARVLQQYALATLFIGTLGESRWTRSDGWLNGTDECRWYGVECEASNASYDDATVVGLSLPSNNLNGFIPPDFFILSNGLQNLDLSTNRLSKAIPSEIGLLSALVDVNMGSNQLTGTIPSSISTIMKLERLNLASNVLTGLIPTEIESLTLLRWIDIRRNYLREALPSQIGKLTKLEYLNVEFNRLAFVIPTEIGRLTRLQVFHGGSNAFVGQLPTEMGPLRSLASVDLSNNLLSGSLPYQITLLSDLKFLDLSINLLSGTVPRDIGLIRRLTSLRLSDNDLWDLIPNSVRFMKDLAHLDVSGNEIDYDGFSALVSVPGSDYGDVPWLELSALTKLKTLKFGGMKARFYNDELLYLTNLEVLSLSGSNLGKWSHPFVLDAASMLTSLTALTTLKELDLSHTNMEDINFPNMLSALTNLEVLNLNGNNFKGRLDTTLGLLSKLLVLNAEGSTLTGTIPTEIYNLSKLIHLNLAGPNGFQSPYADSELAGSIPSMIGQLQHLKRLNLALTQLGGSIPSEIGLAQELEVIQLHASAITGPLPTEIRLLGQLRSLDVHSTGLSGSIPNLDGTFEELERLDLSLTLLTGPLPSGLWSLSTLTLLDLSGAHDTLGSIPSDIMLMSKLTHLALGGVNFAGSTLPSTIGLLSTLQTLDLSGCQLSGTIPSELFQCTQLTNLSIGGGTALSGSIPSEIGLATNLLNLQIANAPIVGNIPAEVSNLLLLESLDLSKTYISGTIPIEMVEELVLLEDLNLDSTRITGSIPTETSGLLSLRTLSLADTDLNWTIPSEIGLLVDLERFNISYTSFLGTIPIEMTNLTILFDFDLRESSITGSIPDDVCDEFTVGNTYGIPTVYIDCDEVQCNCCQCSPTISPSASLNPSFPPSTREPSMSISPTTLPSESVVPSSSFVPTESRTCSPFSGIRDIGTSIFESWETDDSFVLVAIPFPFKWRGHMEYSTLTASPNGAIVLGDIFGCTTCGFYQDCCEAFPVGEFAGFGLPRIALGQTDLAFDAYGSIPINAYYAVVDGAFVISYEGVDFLPTVSDKPNLYFQAVLYPDGSIEMRWGQGFPRKNKSVAVGLEDGDIAVPATGAPFDNRGVTGIGTWPTNQCRTFVVTSNGNYTEYYAPSAAPSDTSSPSASSVPTLESACELFLPIAAFGTPVFISFPSFYENKLDVVALPFDFKWRGQEPDLVYTSVSISENGAIFLGNATDCPVWCPYELVKCCEAFPIGDLSESEIPRIAVAQEELSGEVYYATVGDAFIISFEGSDFFPRTDDSSDLYFQVALYADGRVELRWGQGFPWYHDAIAAGLEDFDIAVPVTGFPFGSHGVTAFGEWPTDQCRMFVPTADGNYVENF